MPTLADDSPPIDRSTLKPSHAVAPPPRTPPRSQSEPLPSFDEFVDDSDEFDIDEPTVPIETTATAAAHRVETTATAAAHRVETTATAAAEPRASAPSDLGTTMPSPSGPPVETTVQATNDERSRAPEAAPPAPVASPSAATSEQSPRPPTSALPDDGTMPSPLALLGSSSGVRTATLIGLSVPLVALLAYAFRGTDDPAESRPERAADVGTLTAKDDTPVPEGAARREPTAPTPEPTPDPASAPTPITPRPTDQAPRAGCTVVQAARRVAEDAYLGVPPLGAPGLDGELLLGFAASPKQAMGLRVRLDDSRVERDFERSTRNGILGVVPGVVEGKRLFWVDVSGGSLQGLRTISASRPFAIGLQGGRLVHRSPSGLTPIWNDLPSEDLTTPRVASTSDRHAIVTRLGGVSGSIVTGWLDAEGTSASPMFTVKTDDREVGTPGVALGESDALITFAARREADDEWGVRLALLRTAPISVDARRFTPPAGGPGGPAISPAAATLPEGHFLLVWTEGPSGKRDVRAQVVTNDLAPRGDPITLSPPGANAGQGIPFTLTNLALVTFYVKTESGMELWGANLRCNE
jgi:hypothetical protein